MRKVIVEMRVVEAVQSEDVRSVGGVVSGLSGARPAQGGLDSF
jgi:hypothetical protein